MSCKQPSSSPSAPSVPKEREQVTPKPNSKSTHHPPTPEVVTPPLISRRISNTAATTASGLIPHSSRSTNATSASWLRPVWSRSDSSQMISIDSREVDNDGGSDRDRDADTDDEESMGTYPDTGRGRRYPSIAIGADASARTMLRSSSSLL